ncbi:hypothetical protein OAR97_05230 [Arcobacteraceae bacterium]|nr:hypothetical protein [Arcobacteraceae bacterium]
MHKKLTKYIESYDMIKETNTYDLIPNGGMIVLINNKSNYSVTIEDISYEIKEYQSILINAYTKSLELKSKENINMVAVRFKGAGASFFYEKYMDELMYNPNEPIYIENNDEVEKLDPYFLNRLKVGTLPFNIMKIIDLLDVQGSDFNIDEVLRLANVPRRILDKTFRLRAGMSFKNYAGIKELSSPV